jgi:hypothetical protein
MAQDQLRIDKAHDWLVTVGHLEVPDPEPSNEAHLHGVGPPDGAQHPCPDSNPSVRLYPEIRIELVHARDLRGHGRHIAHSGGGSDPKLVCDGAAKELAEDDPAMAGAARPDRTTSMRPVRRSWYIDPLLAAPPRRST